MGADSEIGTDAIFLVKAISIWQSRRAPATLSAPTADEN